MSLLTLSDLLAAYKTVSPDKEWALGGMENANKFANAIESAVLARLATVSVEPLAYVSEDELGYVEEGGRCGAFYGVKTNPDLKDAPGFVPVYTAPQLAAARVQALEEFKAELADALCADCENGVKSLNVKALEKFRNDYPTLSALIVGKDV